MGITSRIKWRLNSLAMMLKEEKEKPIYVTVDNDKMLEGKIALITGGSSGIGFAIAKIFIKSSAKFIIAGKNEKN